MPVLRIFVIFLTIYCSLAFQAHAASNEKTETRISKIEQRQETHEAKVDVQVEKIRNEVQSTKDSLETARKNLEWWISSLGLVAAAVGVLAALFPIFWTRQERQRLREEIESARRVVEEIDRDRRDIQAKLDDARRLAVEAEARVEHIRDHEREAEKLKRNIARADAPQADIDKSRKALRKDHSDAAKLAEQALAAGEHKNWEKAAVLWEALTVLQPDNPQAWFNLAYAKCQTLSSYSDATEIQAISEAYSKAIALDPNDFASWNNLGSILVNWGITLKGENAIQRFSDACEKYSKATSLEAANNVAWTNWGNALLHWGRSLKGDAAQEKFADAYKKYTKAANLEPEDDFTWLNWGNALAEWACTLEGDAAAEKFAEASKKYAELTHLKPDLYSAWLRWGSTLINWAQTLQGKLRITKLIEARQVCETAEKLNPGSGAYNLACVAALLEEAGIAKTWLETSRTYGNLPDINHLHTDRDLNSLRNLDWFQAMLAELDPSSAPQS